MQQVKPLDWVLDTFLKFYEQKGQYFIYLNTVCVSLQSRNLLFPPNVRKIPYELSRLGALVYIVVYIGFRFPQPTRWIFVRSVLDLKSHPRSYPVSRTFYPQWVKYRNDYNLDRVPTFVILTR